MLQQPAMHFSLVMALQNGTREFGFHVALVNQVSSDRPEDLVRPSTPVTDEKFALHRVPSEFFLDLPAAFVFYVALQRTGDFVLLATVVANV